MTPSFGSSVTLGSSRAGFAISSDAHSLSVSAPKGALDQPGLLAFLHRSPLVLSSQTHTQWLILLYRHKSKANWAVRKSTAPTGSLSPNWEKTHRHHGGSKTIRAAKLAEQPAAVQGGTAAGLHSSPSLQAAVLSK